MKKIHEAKKDSANSKAKAHALKVAAAHKIKEIKIQARKAINAHSKKAEAA
jgi:hypothetical protein